MPGKPFQSKLSPHEDEIFALLDAGRSFRQVRPSNGSLR